MREVRRIVFGFAWLYWFLGLAPTVAWALGLPYWPLWVLAMPLVYAVVALAWIVGESLEV